MDIYHYDPISGRYTKPGVADPDQLAEGDWLIPAFATADEPPPEPEGMFAAFIDGAWTLLPEPEPEEPPEPDPETPEQTKARLSRVLQALLDTTAQSQDFDNIFTAVTYADEPAVPRFQIQGAALRAWRSLVWAAGYAVMDAVLAGERPIPTEEELLAEMPVFAPPLLT